MAFMRSIPLLTVKMEGGPDMDYKSLLLLILRQPKQGGADYAEMEKMLPILAAIKSGTESAFLSEEQWAEAVSRVSAFKNWAVIVPENKDFVDHIKNAPKVEMVPA